MSTSALSAPYTSKSTCITGILEAEAAYMMESVIRFIDATDDLAFCHGRSGILPRTIWYFSARLIALKAPTQDSIGLTEELEQVEKSLTKSLTKSQTLSCEKLARVSR